MRHGMVSIVVKVNGASDRDSMYGWLYLPYLPYLLIEGLLAGLIARHRLGFAISILPSLWGYGSLGIATQRCGVTCGDTDKGI